MDQYNKIKVIGKGSYGEVWLVRHKRDKKQYVLKKLALQDASKREQKAAEQESKLLSKLKHPNIVSYKDTFEFGGNLYIAMGFCEGGDLYNKLKEQKGTPLEERQVVEWFVQIAMALQYMHERNILHRDLKTQNIFLTKSKIIKVGDLGIARVLDSSSDMATTLIGTPYYMSPELFSNKPYNHKSDVWALGCCVYEMATLKHAFNAKDMNSLVYKILRGKMPNMPKQYSQELVTLIKAMLNSNPDRRPSVNRILRDPYIKRNIAAFLDGTKKRRPSSSSGRPSTADASSRRSSLSSDVGDSQDNGRPKSASSASKSNDRARPTPKIVVLEKEENLEPLQIGPELDVIAEEPGTGEFKSEDSSKAKPSVSKSRLEPSRSDSPSSRSDDVWLSNKESRSSNSKQSDSSVARSKESPSRRKLSPRRDAGRSPRRNGGRSPGSSPKDRRRHSDPSKSSQDRPRSSEEQVSVELSPRPRVLFKKKKRLKPTTPAPPIVISVQDTQEDPLNNDKVLRRSSDQKSESSKIKEDAKENASVDTADSKTDRDRDSSRPLPPMPRPSSEGDILKPKHSSSHPSNRESGYGSSNSVSSSCGISKDETDDGNPPLTARQRRRQQRRDDVETPRTARSIDLDKGRRSLDVYINPKPAGRMSADYANTEANKRNAANFKVSQRQSNSRESFKPKSKSEPVKSVPLKPKGHKRQPSLGVSSSSSEEDDDSEEQIKKREDKRNKKEFNNFISLLNTTLHMKKSQEDEEEEELEVPAEEEKKEEPTRSKMLGSETYAKPAPSTRDRSKIPHIDPVLDSGDSEGAGASRIGGAKSMTTTGRLWERITILRKDCIRGLGVEKLKRAYDILDHLDGDELEPQLIELLGKDDFDIYAGKIWQLKFCEEAAFGLS